MPRDKRRFWNRIARSYAARPVGNPEAYEHKLRVTRDLLKDNMRVFELGCGSGTTALHHAPFVSQMDAIDFSSEMIAIAREKAKTQAQDNILFDVATVETWTGPVGGYDMIMAHSVLHLMDDLPTALAQIHRLLKPQGIFVSSTVCIRDMNRLVPLLLPIGGALGLVPKVLPLSSGDLTQAIEAAGFQIETSWRPQPDAAVFIVARLNGSDQTLA